MQQGLCNVTVFVRLPVCPSYRLLQQRAAGLLLWIAGQEISIDCFTAGAQQHGGQQHGGQQQRRAVSRFTAAVEG